MVTLISPAKDLNFETEAQTSQFSIPEDLETSEKVMAKLSGLSKKKLMNLMDISEKLAELNLKRNHQWSSNFTNSNSKQAILAFNGDVYRGLQASDFTDDDLNFAQQHVRILSGLHGMLRPLDLIQPYRLEMGSKLGIGKKKNLYAVWKESVQQRLKSLLDGHDSKFILNLASQEYFEVVDTDKLKTQVITPSFKDNKNGTYKVLFLYAKIMRGKMTRYIIQEKIDDPQALKEYAEDGYSFNNQLSDKYNWVFTRG